MATEDEKSAARVAAQVAKRRVGLPLSRLQRASSGLGAVAGLGAGGVAVFETNNEAGSVALLAVGVLFSFVALAGLLPTRLKLGDNEIEWQQLAEALSDVVDETPPESRPALLKSIADLSIAAPPLAGQSLTVAAEEAELLNLLRAAMPAHLQWQTELQGRFDRGLDALITNPADGRILGVEFKISSRLVPSSTVFRVVGRVALLREEYPLTGVLLVTNKRLTADARKAAAVGGLAHIVVTGPEDIPELREAIERCLSTS